MSYACIAEPLRAANLLADQRLYELEHFSNRGTSHSSGAPQINGVRALDEAKDLDMLLVVAGGDPFQFDDPEIMAWLRN